MSPYLAEGTLQVKDLKVRQIWIVLWALSAIAREAGRAGGKRCDRTRGWSDGLKAEGEPQAKTGHGSWKRPRKLLLPERGEGGTPWTSDLQQRERVNPCGLVWLVIVATGS